MTLAEHIIEATPERIKQENFVPTESPALERTDAATISSTMSWLAGYLADADHLPNAAQIRSVVFVGHSPGRAPGFPWRLRRPTGSEEFRVMNGLVKEGRKR